MKFRAGRIPEAARKQRLWGQLSSTMNIATGAAAGSLAAETAQFAYGGSGPHGGPALALTVATMLFAGVSYLASMQQTKLGGRGFVITIGKHFENRHRSAVAHLLRTCSIYADVELAIQSSDPPDRVMGLARDLTSSVVDSDFTTSGTSLRRKIILHAHMREAVVMGRVLATFIDPTPPVILQHKLKDPTGYFEALRVPVPAGEADQTMTVSVEEAGGATTLLAVGINVLGSPDFAESVRASMTSLSARRLILLEAPTPLEGQHSYEPLMRRIEQEVKANLPGCDGVVFYISAPSALAVGIGSLSLGPRRIRVGSFLGKDTPYQIDELP